MTKWLSSNSSHVKKLNATLHIVVKDISLVDVKKWEEKITDEPVDPVTEGFKILITEI